MHHRIDRTMRLLFILLGLTTLFVFYAGGKQFANPYTPPHPAANKADPVKRAKLPPGYYNRLSGFDRHGGYKNPIGDTRFKEIALTFDIGNLSAAEYILDLLKKEGIKATLFLANNQSYLVRGYEPNGKKIFHRTLEETDQDKVLRALLKRMGDEGHEVGNHTWSHHNWTRGVDVGNKPFPVSKQLLHKELAMVKERFFEVTGKNLSPIWRSPFGACDMKILKWAKEAGYSHIFWSKGMDSLDWTDNATAVATLKLMQQNARPGGVYLFHLGNALRTRADKIHTILPQLIAWLRQQGYSMVTVTELLDGKPNNRPAS